MFLYRSHFASIGPRHGPWTQAATQLVMATLYEAIMSFWEPRRFCISVLKHAFDWDGTVPDSIFCSATNPIELSIRELPLRG